MGLTYSEIEAMRRNPEFEKESLRYVKKSIEEIRKAVDEIYTDGLHIVEDDYLFNGETYEHPQVLKNKKEAYETAVKIMAKVYHVSIEMAKYYLEEDINVDLYIANFIFKYKTKRGTGVINVSLFNWDIYNLLHEDTHS